MILLGAMNISFGALGESFRDVARAELSAVEAHHQIANRFHSSRAFEGEDGQPAQEDRDCNDSEHDACHTCHFGHCSYTLTSRLEHSTGLTFFDLVLLSSNETLLGVSLSGLKKPPRA